MNTEKATLVDGRKQPFIWLNSLIDFVDISLEAFRVYVHLSRRADQSGRCFPGYKKIGKFCFPKHHPDTQRKKAINAIQELIKNGMVEKEAQVRDNGINSSNIYTLLDCSEWLAIPIHSEWDKNVPGRGPKTTPLEQEPKEQEPKEQEPKEESHPSANFSSSEEKQTIFNDAVENLRKGEILPGSFFSVTSFPLESPEIKPYTPAAIKAVDFLESNYMTPQPSRRRQRLQSAVYAMLVHEAAGEDLIKAVESAAVFNKNKPHFQTIKNVWEKADTFNAHLDRWGKQSVEKVEQRDSAETPRKEQSAPKWTPADFANWTESGKTPAEFVEKYKIEDIERLDALRKAPDPRDFKAWRSAGNEILARHAAKRSAFYLIVENDQTKLDRFVAAFEKIKNSAFPPASFGEFVEAFDSTAREIVENSCGEKLL